MSAPLSTPWGLAQHRKEMIPGVWSVDTAGHGGFWLSPERRDQLPAWARLAPSTYCSKPEWWEEDCEAAIPLLVWLDEFHAAGLCLELDRAGLIRSARFGNRWMPSFETETEVAV